MREYGVGDEPVPGYQIIRALGAGGCGTVWVAKSPGDVEIALKIINLEGQGLKEFRAVGIVKRLRHPNLIPIYAFWLKDEFGNFLDSTAQDSVNLRGKRSELIIAMGLGDKSLRERLEECHKAFAQRHGLPDIEASLVAKLNDLGGTDHAGLPVEELLEYMFGAARAIDYLNQPTHTLGTGPPASIQHCDIKPGNLLIVGNDVQVCDYGLAKVLTTDARKTQAAYTPAYMAPELFANNPSSGTDQYSLAISYYELRVGKLPFEEQLAFHAHITGQLDFSLVSPAEQEILRKASHMRPAERYQHTIEMVRALREAISPSRPITPSSTPGVISAPPLAMPGSSPPPVQSGSSPSGVYRSGGPAAATPSATPTIVTKPTVLDDLIRAGVELVPGHWLVQLLGRGGYGEVWKARMSGNTHCALKIVRNLDAVQGKQELKSLDLIRDLDHDRLIKLQAYWLLAYDGSVIPDDQIGQPGAPKSSGLVVATDLAAKNLLQYWQEWHEQGHAGIPVKELASFVHQAADAIDHLNFQDPAIIHRDIKPENILLTKNNQVKVSDFGLAKIVEGASADIHSASVGMTLAYAAPEMFKNKVTRWTDQYSLAVTYYRLRVGKLPFEEGLGPIQMMQAHATGSLDFGGVGVPEQQVLGRACAVEEERRYGSCLEFAEALATAVGLSRPGVTTSSIPQTHPVSSPSMGNRWPTDTARMPAGAAPSATARMPAASDGGSNVRETLQFEESKSPLGRPHPAPPVQKSSGEFALPGEPKRPSGLPPGLMETTTAVPSASDEDTDPDSARTDWRKQAATTQSKGGGKTVAIAAAVAALVVVGAGGVWWMNRGPATTVSTEPKDPKAELLAKADSDVSAALGANDFAAAAGHVKTAASVAGADWAKTKNDTILAAWRQYADRSGEPKDKMAEFQRLLESYPEDATSKKRIAVIKFGIDNKQITDQFKAALADLKSNNIPDGRGKLADVKKELDRLDREAPDEEVRSQIVAVRDAVGRASKAADDLEKVTGEPATEQSVTELATNIDKMKPSDDAETAMRDAYRGVLSKRIERLVPSLGTETKNWAALRSACRTATGTGPANPWVAACGVECVAELLGRGQSAGSPEDRVAPTAPAGADPRLAAYCRYVAAAVQWAANSGSKVGAEALAALVPDTADSPAELLNAYRRGRVLAGLRAAAARLRGDEAMRPYAQRGTDAARWLAAASRLADKDAKLPPAERLRLKYELALAYLAEQPPQVEKARPLVDELVREPIQKQWQPGVQEQVLLWSAYARSQEAGPAGRLPAVRAYGNMLSLLSDDLSGVSVKYLFDNLIHPLDVDGGKSILGDKPDGDTLAAAARLYFLAGRNVRRYSEAWNDVADLGQPAERDRERRRLVIRMFDRAAQLDKKPEYRAWAGIARSEVPGGGDPAVGLSSGTGAVAPAMYLLRGIVLITQAEQVPNLATRVSKWREADALFRTGIEQCGTRPEFRDEKVLLYQRAANNCIALANAVVQTAPREGGRFLDDAKGFADKLLQLDPGRLEGYDSLGCALEDMAWLRKDADRFAKNGKYAQAVDAFSKVTSDVGGQASPWMHRGRCRFKWAEDALAQPGSSGLDGGLVAAANADLDKVLEISPDTVEAAEAHYWKAEIALLIGRATPQADAAAQYSQAAGEFQRAVELGKTVSAAWYETALLEWSNAAYAEADRLAPARNQMARDALTDALARADATKVFSPPWAALLTMKLMTEVQRKLEPTKDRVKDAMKVAEEGLDPNCRAQDRAFQFMIRMLLVDYQTSGVVLRALAEYKDGQAALKDAEAGMKLVKEARLSSADDAQAHGAKGMAYYVIYATTRRPEDMQQSKNEFAEAVRIDADHPLSWKWKSFLGIYIGLEKAKGNTTEELLASEATRLATGYRLCREAETTLDAKKKSAGLSEEEEQYLKSIVAKRQTFVEPGFPRWLSGIKDQPQNPDRYLWLLAAAERMVLDDKEDQKKAREYVDEAKKIIAGLTEDEREASRRQVERIEVLWLLPQSRAKIKDDLAGAKRFLDEAKKIVASMPEGQRWAYRGDVRRTTVMWLLAAAEKGAKSKENRNQTKEYFDEARKIVAGLPESQRDEFREQIERLATDLR